MRWESTAPLRRPEPPSTTNASSSIVPCPREGCPGIEPGTAHQPSFGGFSCRVLPELDPGETMTQPASPFGTHGDPRHRIFLPAHLRACRDA